MKARKLAGITLTVLALLGGFFSPDNLGMGLQRLEPWLWVFRGAADFVNLGLRNCQIFGLLVPAATWVAKLLFFVGTMVGF